MNVSVFTIGRFHHFDLGRQLVRLGHGLSMYTSNPKMKVDRDLLPYARTRATYRIPFAVGCRLGLGDRLYWLDEMLLKDMGKWLSREVDLKWSDVLHALDGAGPAAGRRIKAEGKLWVCDRASTHVLEQKEILDQEHKEWGVRAQEFSSHRLERCIAEYEESHGITVPSHFAKRSFVNRGVEESRVFVCPYGVNLIEFRADKKRDDVFRVLHVGQINVRKGIGYLLRALAPLVEKKRCQLWLVGEVDPKLQPLLRTFRGRFEYKGLWARKDLWRIYAQSSVLVLASVEDGLGLVQAQAMACGVPVIATSNTGAEDLFADGVEGFIVPARDDAAIRERVEWLIDNRDKRDAMGAAALKRMRDRGGWNHYGDAVQGVYTELALRHGVQVREPCGSHV